MARKRLNKKVLIVGLLLLVILAVGAIVVMLDIIGSAGKFEKYGQQAWAEKDYKKASRYYSKAIGRSKTDSGKIELYFKLAELFIESNEWPNPVECWNKIATIDKKNVEALRLLLDFFYQVADVPSAVNWERVMTHSDNLLELSESEDQLKPILPYLYTARGRAKLTTIDRVADSQARLDEAVSDLEKAKELEPDNIDIYQYLASAAIAEGQLMTLKGIIGQKSKAYSRAETILEEAVSIAEDDPNTHLNLLRIKLTAARSDRDIEKIEALEAEHIRLAKKFPSSARVFSALASYYAYIPKELDKAIENSEKAAKLDSDNVGYARQLSQLYYQKGSFGRQPDYIAKAIELVEQASMFPDANNESGPRGSVARMNKFFLYNLRVVYYLDLALNYPDITTQDQREGYILNAKETLHEIAQFLGSAENTTVVKYQGMLDLAKGNRAEAVKNMLTAYEQIRSEGNIDVILSYQLAKIVANSPEIGAARDFLKEALVPVPEFGLSGGIARSKPEALLDYVSVLFKLREYPNVLSITDFYENSYGSNDRSRELRFNSYIASRQFDKAEEFLSQDGLDKKTAVKMNFLLTNAQIQKLEGDIAREKLRTEPDTAVVEDKTPAMLVEVEQKKNEFLELAEELIEIEPDEISGQVVAVLCKLYLSMDKKDSAEALLNKILANKPEDLVARIYIQFLKEPDPKNIPEERATEIEKEILSKLGNPVQRTLNMAAFYQRINDVNNAILEYKKVYGLKSTKDYSADNIRAVKANVSKILFNIASTRNDLDLIQELVTLSRKNNYDGCEGNFYAGRLALFEERNAEALSLFNQSLDQRPFFSFAYYFRSMANERLGNFDASVADAEKAASLNPLGGNIARQFALLVYRRNQNIGATATQTQKKQVRDALIRAIRLNPTEWQLQSLYAEYIAEQEPIEALAMRQSLQKQFPTIGNALLLGEMATRMLAKESDSQKKQSLAEIASSSFDKALSIDAKNKEVIQGYSLNLNSTLT